MIDLERSSGPRGEKLGVFMFIDDINISSTEWETTMLGYYIERLTGDETLISCSLSNLLLH